jgi:hypothetical protein
MTTKLRTGLLLVFTAMTGAASLSGCIVETTSGGPKANCADERFFQVYWSVAANPASDPYTCTQTPSFTEVQLDTSTGTYRVGRECRATSYMNFVFDWRGSSVTAIPTGTYVTEAHLIGPDGVTSLSAAPGAGSQYQMPSCAPMEIAYVFDLN